MSIGGILNSVGRTVLKLGYEISPILLTGGVAEKLGGTVPILLYTEAIAAVNGLIAGGLSGKLNLPDLDNMWCTWNQLSGSTLVDNDVATYPFANQTLAANAVVNKPLTVSMQMRCPPNGPGAMVTKLATLQALSAVLNKHVTMGGEFVVITPGQIYTNMLLVRMADTSPNPATQPSSQFQLDFTRPLTQADEAVQKQGTLMKKLSGGMPGIGGWGSTGSGNLLEGPLTGLGII